MNRKNRLFALLLASMLLFTGCSMRTVEEMYQLPKRSKEFDNLQTVIDSTMSGLVYSAPLAGENRQTIQMADLDGDGVQEYLLFAKARDSSESPLKILVFSKEEDTFVHKSTISGNGAAFDQVEYVQMDNRPGLEVIVGTQVSDQVLRSAAIYTFAKNGLEQMVSVNYSKFLAADMDGDAYSELFVLRPGTDQLHGVAELYGIEKGTVERTNEVNMSQETEKLKRILVGKLQSGETAIYVASAVDETTIVTDVFSLIDKKLTNITFSNESGTSVHTLRNYYVYADDIDDDGVVELPYLIKMTMLDGTKTTDRQDLIRWYAMRSDGTETDKLYTFHNFVGGWYMRLEKQWAERISVKPMGNSFEFYVCDENGVGADQILTVYAFTGQDREELSTSDDRFVLLKTESVIYSARLEKKAQELGINRDTVINSFRLIQQDWKTGEM